jgi:predicted phage terminase large subunit-like protein
VDKEIKNILSTCSVSTKATAQTFFPERFYVPFAENVHDKIFNLVDGSANKVAIAAPRGWGKTSIVALALIARYILFRKCEFIVYINMSHDAAALQTENLRRELTTNLAIRQFFGPIRPRGVKRDEVDESFSKKAWVAYDTFVLPRGSGQQVRGVLFKNSRPGLIVIDDLEDPETIMGEVIRDKRKQWLYADVIKAVPRLHKDWKIVYIDTLKHEDALMQHLLNAPDWESVRLEACDDNFQSAAPHFVSNEDIQKEWEEHQKAGMTDVFFRELRNLPISTKDAAFQQNYFRYYGRARTEQVGENDLKKIDAEIQADQNIETVVILDPAKTVKIHSAESAIVGIGIDLRNARLYIRDAISEKMYPDEIYEALFGMAVRLDARVLGVEETSLNEFIKQPIKNEMLKRGKFFQLIWLKARGGMKKELRVKELVPYYRQGYVYHNAACPTIKKLEAQLLMFPRSALWDLMDCLAYIIEMLELGERYFAPKEDLGDVEAEYDELTYEEPISNWRYA